MYVIIILRCEFNNQLNNSNNTEYNNTQLLFRHFQTIRRMNCSKCNNQEWCMCQVMLRIHKKTVSKHNQCLCCIFRDRTIEEFNRNISPQRREEMRIQSKALLESYKKLQTMFPKNGMNE